MAGSNTNIVMKLLPKVIVSNCLFIGTAPSVLAQAAVPPSFVTVTRQFETPAMFHARRQNAVASPWNRLATLVFEVNEGVSTGELPEIGCSCRGASGGMPDLRFVWHGLCFASNYDSSWSHSIYRQRGANANELASF